MNYKEAIVEIVGKIQNERILKRDIINSWRICTPMRLTVVKKAVSLFLYILV